MQKEVFEAVTARPYNSILLYSFCGPESLKFFPALNITYLCKVVLYTILPYVKFLLIIIVVPLLYSTDQLQLKFKVIRNASIAISFNITVSSYNIILPVLHGSQA